MARKKQDEKESPYDVLADLSDDLGFSPMGNTSYGHVENYMPTFLPELDKILGGGIPFKRITEVFAPEQTGKSTFMAYLAHVANMLGINVFWIDTEATADRDHMIQLGVDVKKTRILVPKKDDMTVQLVGEVSEKLLDAYLENDELNKNPIIIVWDSLAGTISQGEKDVDFDQEGARGLKAKAITRLVSKLTPKIGATNVSFMAVNQVRANQQQKSQYDSPYVRPGAAALDHGESLRLGLSKGKKITINASDKVYRGHTVHVETDKNKQYAPHRRIDLYLLSGYDLDTGETDAAGNEIYESLQGFDYDYNIYASALEDGIVKSKGSYKDYTMDDGTEVHKYEKDFILSMKMDKEHKIRKELFRKLMYRAFPEKIPYAENTLIDYHKWPDWDHQIDEHYAKISSELKDTDETEETTPEPEETDKETAE